MCIICDKFVNMKIMKPACVWPYKQKTRCYVMYTFTTRSVTQTDRYLAILATIIHFPLPEALDFRVFIFWGLLFEGLITTSKSLIRTCSFGSREIKPTPSLTKDWRKLSLISPTDTDSTAPCTCYISIR